MASVPLATLPGAHDREHGRALAREPFRRDCRRRARAHQRVVRTVADGERKSGLGMRVDEDREDRRKAVLRVVLADRDPLAGGRLGLLDIGGHHLPFARIAVEHDVALRLHVDAAERRACERRARRSRRTPPGSAARSCRCGRGSASCGSASLVPIGPILRLRGPARQRGRDRRAPGTRHEPPPGVHELSGCSLGLRRSGAGSRRLRGGAGPGTRSSSSGPTSRRPRRAP